MVYLIIVIFLSYLFFVVLLIKGWKKARRQVSSQAGHDAFITVVIPIRNEEHTIGTLLSDLAQQRYQAFEVIVVDDHSIDTTAQVVKPFTLQDSRFRLVTSPMEGKKQALTLGIQEARGTVIVTTDGDCRVNESWLMLINRHFQEDRVKLAFGGVALLQDDRFFSTIQAIEFSSLIGSGAATWAWGYPTMCNGANLAFRKKVFEEVDGYTGNVNIASGDDEFLLRKVIALYPGGVSFMSAAGAVVRTHPAGSLKDFFRQRIRWAGKWRHNTSLHAKLLALYIFLVQVMLIVTMALLFSCKEPVRIIAWSIVIARFVVEAFFLYPVCKFLNVRWRWPAYIVLQVFYPLYVVVTGLFSNVIPVTWKNRNV
jgi:biofilm PGA synthesis N-glycosyltransferase PgaC